MAYRRHHSSLYPAAADAVADRGSHRYENHSALSGLGADQPGRHGGQNLWISFMQLLPYVLQSGILILFAVLFCWVSAGFWTALMGFLQLLIGRDKYSISASTVGDEPLNPAHRTALIMPICNEDVDRVFAGLRATGVGESDR